MISVASFMSNASQANNPYLNSNYSSNKNSDKNLKTQSYVGVSDCENYDEEEGENDFFILESKQIDQQFNNISFNFNNSAPQKIIITDDEVVVSIRKDFDTPVQKKPEEISTIKPKNESIVQIDQVNTVRKATNIITESPVTKNSNSTNSIKISDFTTPVKISETKTTELKKTTLKFDEPETNPFQDDSETNNPFKDEIDSSNPFKDDVSSNNPFKEDVESSNPFQDVIDLSNPFAGDDVKESVNKNPFLSTNSSESKENTNSSNAEQSSVKLSPIKPNLVKVDPDIIEDTQSSNSNNSNSNSNSELNNNGNKENQIKNQLNNSSTSRDLLDWCKDIIKSYKKNKSAAIFKNVIIQDFSKSWKSGLAFCAIIYYFKPNSM